MAAASEQPAAATLVSGVTFALRRLGQRVTADDIRAEAAAAAAAARKGGGASGRSSVTLADLVGAGLIAPCAGCITVSYKTQTWTADLAADGAIEFEGQRFSSTTAFSIHCKRKITPGKQADDGWKCVYYRGQPLADFRAAFERQVPAPGAAGGGAAGAAAATAALAPTRTSGRQRKKKRFDSDSEGEAYAGDALTDEAYAMFLSAAEHQVRQAQQAQQARQAQQAAQQAQQEVIVELPAGVEVPNADRWVQCDRCQEWRVVPAENWQAVQDDPREEWFCEYAAWDVTKQPPHKPACKKRGGGKASGSGKASGGGKASGRGGGSGGRGSGGGRGGGGRRGGRK